MLSGYNTAGMVVADLRRRNGRRRGVTAPRPQRERATV
jgi:hypothetical protein